MNDKSKKVKKKICAQGEVAFGRPETTDEQRLSITLNNCLAAAGAMSAFSVIVLRDAETGLVMANTTAPNVENFAEMLASFVATYIYVKNIPSEDFVDIFFSYFDNFVKRVEG